MSERALIVDETQAGERLDIFLAKNCAECSSRTAARRLIDEHHVTVNGQDVRAHHKVHTGENIVIAIPVPTESGIVSPEQIVLDIIYEDEHLLVINKPLGMLSHPVHGQNTGTLVNAIMHHCQSLSSLNDPDRPGIVHRLDRETSGIIITVKNNKAHAILAKQFENRQVVKKYVAIVKGYLGLDEGMIDAPIARHAVHFDKKTVSYDTEKGRPAQTFYKVIKRIGEKATMVALFPKTGRTHQLRVHMKYLGHPILGDEKYGSGRSFPRLALHAQCIGFHHPVHGYFMECSVPLPEEFLHAEEIVSSSIVY